MLRDPVLNGDIDNTSFAPVSITHEYFQYKMMLGGPLLPLSVEGLVRASCVKSKNALAKGNPSSQGDPGAV